MYTDVSVLAIGDVEVLGTSETVSRVFIVFAHKGQIVYYWWAIAAQLIGESFRFSKKSFALEKCRQPKNPR